MAFARRRTERRVLDEAALVEYAVKSLGSRMRTERDLRRSLRERAEPGEVGQQTAETVITKMKELGYLSDERFAADYTRLRQENQRFGPRRVQQGLMQKGVAAPLVERTITEAYEAVDEVALAMEFVARKRLKAVESDDPAERQRGNARLLRRLIAGGFSSPVAFQVMRRMAARADDLPGEDAVLEMEEATPES